MKKAVLFDLDGTLTNTSLDICDNVNLTMRKFGYPEITVEETKLFVGYGAKRLIESSLKGQPCDNFDEVVAFYNKACNFCGSPRTFVYEGMIDLLKKLKEEGYLLAIISNKPQEGTTEVCKTFFSEIEFDFVFGQREGIKVKPDRGCVDFTLNYDIQFNLMTSAFLGGTADYCTVFEPTASEYEKNGSWHVVASVGAQGGEIPYTSFIALQSYLKNNENAVKSFLKGLKKAHEFMATHSDLEVAQAIVKQFPSTTINSIETSIKSYREIDAWKTNLQATEDSFNRLQDIMINSNELDSKVDFSKIVNNKLAKEIFG